MFHQESNPFNSPATQQPMSVEELCLSRETFQRLQPEYSQKLALLQQDVSSLEMQITSLQEEAHSSLEGPITDHVTLLSKIGREITRNEIIDAITTLREPIEIESRLHSIKESCRTSAYWSLLFSGVYSCGVSVYASFLWGYVLSETLTNFERYLAVPCYAFGLLVTALGAIGQGTSSYSSMRDYFRLEGVKGQIKELFQGTYSAPG